MLLYKTKRALLLQLKLTKLNVPEYSDHTQHATFHSHGLNFAPIATIPQSHYIIRNGQQEGLEGSHDRAGNIPPSSCLVAPLL